MLFVLFLSGFVLSTTVSIANGAILFSCAPIDSNNMGMTIYTTQTSGWVGVGLGSGMALADVWLMEYQSGGWNLTGRHSTKHALPVLNPNQGVTVVNTTANSVSFTRPLNVYQDEVNFVSGPQNFIWAIRSAPYNDLSQSEHEQMGVFSMDPGSAPTSKSGSASSSKSGSTTANSNPSSWSTATNSPSNSGLQFQIGSWNALLLFVTIIEGIGMVFV